MVAYYALPAKAFQLRIIREYLFIFYVQFIVKFADKNSRSSWYAMQIKIPVQS